MVINGEKENRFMSFKGQNALEYLIMIGGAILFVTLVTVATKSVVSSGGESTGSAAKIIATEEIKFGNTPTAIVVPDIVCNANLECNKYSKQFSNCPAEHYLVSPCTSTCSMMCNGAGTQCQSCEPAACTTAICNPWACRPLEECHEEVEITINHDHCTPPSVNEPCTSTCTKQCNNLGSACDMCTPPACTPKCVPSCAAGIITSTCYCGGASGTKASTGYCCGGTTYSVNPCYQYFSVAINENSDDKLYYAAAGNLADPASLTLGHPGTGMFSSILKFDGIAIPAGAIIDEAYVTFVSTTSVLPNPQGTVQVRIWADRTVNPATLTDISVYDRVRTSAITDWNINGPFPTSTKFNSTDFKGVIQEIVGLSGWVSGKSIVLLFNATIANIPPANRYIRAFNGGAANAPRLYIKYHT